MKRPAHAAPRLALAALVLGLGPLAWWGSQRPSAQESEGAGSAPGAGESSPRSLPELPVVEKPEATQPSIGLETDAHLDKTPPRQTKSLDLVKLGWTYNCMECHRLLESRWHYDRPVVEHEEIALEHGNNRYCLNCHHPTNRNAFVDYDGVEIAEEDVVSLCAKCHGPIFRDWKAGVHGRRNGYWDTKRGLRTQLKCVQCHDPHRPKFKSMKPLTPPNYPPRAAGGKHERADAHEGKREPPRGTNPTDRHRDE